MPAPRVTINDLPDQAAVEDTNLLVVQDGTVTKKMAVSLLTTASSAAVTAHISDTTDAHDASAISAVPNVAPMDGDDVQQQLDQAASQFGVLASDVDTVEANLAAHLADATDAHNGSAVSLVPPTGLTATNVQAGFDEIEPMLLPPGGDTSQVLAKVDGSDFNVAWVTGGGGGGSLPIGGTAGQVLTKASAVDGDATWQDSQDAVTSVNGAIGDVVLDGDDITSTLGGSVDSQLTTMAAHIADATDAHDASAISSVPAGNLAATTVQAALNELDAEKAPNVHLHTVGQISDLTASAAELNVLDGITASTTELNFTDGVTSNIQTQLDAKQPGSADLTDLVARWTPASAASAASLNFHEDTDNGTEFVQLIAPSTLASSPQVFLPDISGQLSTRAGAETLTNKTISGASNTLSNIDTGSIPNLAEFVRDTMGTALVAGANVTITPNDVADTITIASAGGGGGGSLADGDYGDIVVSGTGTVMSIDTGAVVTAKIANDNVTYAKIQNVSATDRLLGRVTAGAGDIEEIACTAAGRDLLDDADAAAQRTTLGLGALATATTINNAQWSGTDLSVTNGGTGASDAATARTNLGLAIGTDVQAHSDILDDMAGLTQAADRLPYFDSATTMTTAVLTTAGRALLDDANAAAQRTTLGLAIGTDVQAFSSVLTDLATRWDPADGTAAAGLVFAEDTDNGTNTTTVRATASIGTNNTLTLPLGDGTLVSDSSTVTLSNKTLTDAKVTQALNAQSGTTYTTVLADASKVVTLNNAAAITLTIPPNSSVAYPVGSRIDFIQTGAGQVTITPGAGVTINGTPGLKLRAQHSGASVIKVATDTWQAVGDLSA